MDAGFAEEGLTEEGEGSVLQPDLWCELLGKLLPSCQLVLNLIVHDIHLDL
jgi:hypothetical protein